MGPLHPSSANLAHLLQDFIGTSPRVETLGRLQKSRPERELRQALQVRYRPLPSFTFAPVVACLLGGEKGRRPRRSLNFATRGRARISWVTPRHCLQGCSSVSSVCVSSLPSLRGRVPMAVSLWGGTSNLLGGGNRLPLSPTERVGTNSTTPPTQSALLATHCSSFCESCKLLCLFSLQACMYLPQNPGYLRADGAPL